jgi:hypothetical protein
MSFVLRTAMEFILVGRKAKKKIGVSPEFAIPTWVGESGGRLFQMDITSPVDNEPALWC